MQEDCWKSKKDGQEPGSCHSTYTGGIQANNPPNTDVQWENSDDIKLRTSNVNGAYIMEQTCFSFIPVIQV